MDLSNFVMHVEVARPDCSSCHLCADETDRSAQSALRRPATAAPCTRPHNDFDSSEPSAFQQLWYVNHAAIQLDVALAMHGGHPRLCIPLDGPHKLFQPCSHNAAWAAASMQTEPSVMIASREEGWRQTYLAVPPNKLKPCAASSRNMRMHAPFPSIGKFSPRDQRPEARHSA